jgi:hypothetical protein
VGEQRGIAYYRACSAREHELPATQGDLPRLRGPGAEAHGSPGRRGGGRSVRSIAGSLAWRLWRRVARGQRGVPVGCGGGGERCSCRNRIRSPVRPRSVTCRRSIRTPMVRAGFRFMDLQSPGRASLAAGHPSAGAGADPQAGTIMRQVYVHRPVQKAGGPGWRWSMKAPGTTGVGGRLPPWYRTGDRPAAPGRAAGGHARRAGCCSARGWMTGRRRINTALLKVDPEIGAIYLDELSPKKGHEAIHTGSTLRLVGVFNGVPTHFTTLVLGIGVQKGIAFYRATLPEGLDYQQRRVSYRAYVGRGLNLSVRLVAEDGRETVGAAAGHLPGWIRGASAARKPGAGAGHLFRIECAGTPGTGAHFLHGAGPVHAAGTRRSTCFGPVRVSRTCIRGIGALWSAPFWPSSASRSAGGRPRSEASAAVGTCASNAGSEPS